MAIEYFEKDGELHFSYEKRVSVSDHSNAYRVYKSQGKIPKKIQEQGDQAIKNYAEKKVRKDIKEKESKAKKWDQFAKNPNFPVSVKHQGEILKGKIVSAEDNTLRVRLEEPYQGEAYVHYNRFSAMAGDYIFDGLESFSESAIESAQELLIGIYHTKKHYNEHKKVIETAKRLNK